ncbi:MAG: hexameric tyrosine-coordinated heme protein [Verrucomicrobiota bacterium]
MRLSRLRVKCTQLSGRIRGPLRAVQTENADRLTAALGVIAINFQNDSRLMIAGESKDESHISRA